MYMNNFIREAARKLLNSDVPEEHYGFIKSILYKKNRLSVSQKQMKYLGGLYAHYVDSTPNAWWPKKETKKRFNVIVEQTISDEVQVYADDKEHAKIIATDKLDELGFEGYRAVESWEIADNKYSKGCK